MFPMTVTINNTAQLNAVLAAMGTEGLEAASNRTIAVDQVPAPTVDLQAVVNKAEAKVATGKPKPTPAATPEAGASTQPIAEAEGAGAQEKTAAASVPNAASAETAQQASTAATDAPAITYKDVQAAVVAAVKAGKRSNVVALLTEFGVDHAEKLTPKQWPGALAKLKGMVA